MSLAELFHFLAQQPVLALAVAAIFIATLGSLLGRAAPGLGRLLRGIGNLGVVAALLLTVVQVARFTQGADLALPQIGLPVQRVEGGETRVEASRDGHYWLTGEVNGVRRRFLVDTGATLTTLSSGTAAEAGLDDSRYGRAVLLRTASGTITAQLTSVDELRFGNVVARDLDAVVVPGPGEINVIGMNLLSRLASWRVEGGTMILVPHNPQPAQATAGTAG